ncbi:hypothetical protein ACHAW6_009885 [Cyclotella cf. meneghiniana]
MIAIDVNSQNVLQPSILRYQFPQRKMGMIQYRIAKLSPSPCSSTHINILVGIEIGSVDMFKIRGRIDIKAIVVVVIIIFDGRSWAFCKARFDISKDQKSMIYFYFPCNYL